MTSDKSKIYFDQAAKSYDQFSETQVKMSRHLLTQLDLDFNPQKIIDLGCGTGHALHLLSETYPSAKLHGLDFSDQMLKVAGRRVNSATLYKEDLNMYELKENYDLIFSNATLQWLHDCQKKLEGWTKHLNPGGVIYLGVFLSGTFERISEGWKEITGTTWSAPNLPRLENLHQVLIEQGLVVKHKSTQIYLKEFDSLKEFHEYQKKMGTRAPRTSRRLSKTEYMKLEDWLMEDDKIITRERIGLLVAQKA